MAGAVPQATVVSSAGAAFAPAASVRMPIGIVAAPVGTPTGGVSHFELTISNPQSTPIRLNLSLVDVTGLLTASLPPSVTLAGSEALRLPLEVRQIRPAPDRTRTLQFQITAQYEDGSRAGFVNITLIPTRGARAGGGMPRWLLIGGGIAIVAGGAIGAAVMLKGGGDDPSPATANEQPPRHAAAGVCAS